MDEWVLVLKEAEYSVDYIFITLYILNLIGKTENYYINHSEGPLLIIDNDLCYGYFQSGKLRDNDSSRMTEAKLLLKDSNVYAINLDEVFTEEKLISVFVNVRKYSLVHCFELENTSNR